MLIHNMKEYKPTGFKKNLNDVIMSLDVFSSKFNHNESLQCEWNAVEVELRERDQYVGLLRKCFWFKDSLFDWENV